MIEKLIKTELAAQKAREGVRNKIVRTELTVEQYIVLYVINMNDRCSLSYIYNNTHLSQTTVSRITRYLESIDLIEEIDLNHSTAKGYRINKNGKAMLNLMEAA